MARTRFSGPVASDNGFEFKSDTAYSVTIEAPLSLAADYTFTLPVDDGTNGQVLTTDGSGATSWTTNGAGTVTSVATSGTVNGLTLTGGTITSSGTITLGGTLDLSSPPAIGGTSPSTGAFTSVTASTFLKLTAVATSALPAAGAGNAGQVRLINDNGAGDNEYCLVISTGAAWVTATGGALS